MDDELIEPPPVVYLYEPGGQRHISGQNTGPEYSLALCGVIYRTEAEMITQHRLNSTRAAFQIRRDLHAPVCGKCCEIGARTGGLGIDQMPRRARAVNP